MYVFLMLGFSDKRSRHVEVLCNILAVLWFSEVFWSVFLHMVPGTAWATALIWEQPWVLLPPLGPLLSSHSAFLQVFVFTPLYFPNYSYSIWSWYRLLLLPCSNILKLLYPLFLPFVLGGDNCMVQTLLYTIFTTLSCHCMLNYLCSLDLGVFVVLYPVCGDLALSLAGFSNINHLFYLSVQHSRPIAPLLFLSPYLLHWYQFILGCHPIDLPIGGLHLAQDTDLDSQALALFQGVHSLGVLDMRCSPFFFLCWEFLGLDIFRCQVPLWSSHYTNVWLVYLVYWWHIVLSV